MFHYFAFPLEVENGRESSKIFIFHYETRVQAFAPIQKSNPVAGNRGNLIYILFMT